jgi:hypothetical protein
MPEAESYWCRLVFRCLNCGRKEVFAATSCEGQPHEDQMRAQVYQARCRSCGWQGAFCGFSALEIYSGIEQRTAKLRTVAKSVHA